MYARWIGHFPQPFWAIPMIVACRCPMSWPVRCSLSCILLLGSAPWSASLFAQEGSSVPQADVQTPTAVPYSAEVVAKAESILAGIGLTRVGKAIQSTETAKIARAMSQLTRQRRDLGLIREEWSKLASQDLALQRALEHRNVQEGRLNEQLARGGFLDVTMQNTLVAKINANRAMIRAQLAERDRLQGVQDAARARLHDAEALYAESVLAIREELNTLLSRLDEALTNTQVGIALDVLQRNFDTPRELDAEVILSPVTRRLEKIEEEVFSESIALDVEPNGSLYVPVTVGSETTRMVVDSGASLLSLPAATAGQLGIAIPADAPQLSLVMADGRVIPGRAIILESVRVGQFEAKQVRAAVLDAAAANAEPLLGMSFLSHFKFEINTADKSLKLLRIGPE